MEWSLSSSALVRVGGSLHHLAQAAALCHFCTSGWMVLYGLDTVNSVPLVSFKERLCSKRHTVPQAAVEKMKEEGPGAVWFLFWIYLLNFKLCVRNWNIYTVKTHLQKIPSSEYWVCSAYSWDRAVYWDGWKIWKMLPPPAKVLICFPHRSPLFHLLLVSIYHLK